jgi:DNA-binding beta-propeller fold protein YncE
MIGVRAVWVSVLAGALGCGSVSAGGADAGKDAPATTGAAGAISAGTAGTAGAAGATGTAGAGAGDAGATGTSGATGTAGSIADAGSGGTTGAGGTSGAAPGAFALKAPLSGDPTVTPMPTLTWGSAMGAATYTVEIATASTFGAADVTQKTGLTTTSFAPPDALLPGVIYYWRVTAVSGGGATVATNAPFAMSSPTTAGPSPHGVAVTPDGKRAVITNDKPAGSVTLLDLTTFKTQSIALPGQPGLVAITPDGAHALVPEGGRNDVAIVDLAAGTVAGAITPPCVGTTLYGIAIKADGSAALLPDLSGGCTKDVLDVIPLPGTAISPAIDLSAAGGGFGVAVTPDGASALITKGILSTSVLRVALPGGGLTTIPNTSSSFGVAVTPDGKEALVTSGEGDTIKRISLATNAVTDAITFDTNQDVGNLAIAPNGKVAVAVGDFKVGVINLADGSVTSTFSLAGRSVAITPDSRRALVTGAGATGQIYVIALP